MNLTNLKIFQNESIKNALQKIDINTLGIVFAVNKSNKVIGSVTDGDIRNKLLQGLTLNDKIGLCANRKFVYCTESSPREEIIKQFDNNIKVIPLLNSNKELIGINTKNNFPLTKEKKIIARSKSPVRISFGGGGSDLTHYFKNSSGAVINTTISLYTHCTLIKKNNKKILISSEDLNLTLKANDLKSAINQNCEFGLILSTIKLINPLFGFELHIRSDFPMSSGLGGSAVVVSSIIGCFNEFRIDKWNKYEIAEMAYQSERLYFKISGGWQDQYATVFGGFNFMEFKLKQNIVHPLRLEYQTELELKENLVLCDTCLDHSSSDIHDNQKKQFLNKDELKKLVALNVELTLEIRDNLLKGKLSKIGHLLDKAWSFKKQFSDKISNERLDNIYNTAVNNGAIGGKLLGAGGGGFLFFIVHLKIELHLLKN